MAAGAGSVFSPPALAFLARFGGVIQQPIILRDMLYQCIAHGNARSDCAIAETGGMNNAQRQVRYPSGSFFLISLCSAPAALAAESGGVTIGFVYESPVGDAGWSFSHEAARRVLSSSPGVTAHFVESVPDGFDAERVIEAMARKGYNIIITASRIFADETLRVAAKYPDTTFLNCAGDETAPNASVYFGRMYQARYLTGMVAGAMTKSNVIGYVAAYPIPEVIRGLNAFTLGARAVNPKARVKVTWTNAWYAPAVEKSAALGLIKEKADVVAYHQDTPSAQEAAAEKGVYAIGYNADMSLLYPKTQLVAAVWNWYPFYNEMLSRYRKGQWVSGDYWLGMESGLVDITAFSPLVPEKTRNLVLSRKAEITSGAYKVFQGPVRDTEGRLRIADSEVPSDAELKAMDWLVEGVY